MDGSKHDSNMEREIMSLEDKKKRLKELKKIDFPSDQDYNEIALLEQEIAMEYNEENYKSEPFIMKDENEEPRMKRTVFEFVADKIRGKQTKRDRNKKSIIKKVTELVKEKPVTDEELEQLKKQVIKYRMKADIAKNKEKISQSKGGKLDTLNTLFGDVKNSKKNSFDSGSFGWTQDKSRDRYRKKVLGY